MTEPREISDAEYLARRGLVFAAADAVGHPLWVRFGALPPWFALPVIMLVLWVFPSLWMIPVACLYIFAYVHARMRRLAPPARAPNLRERMDRAKRIAAEERKWEVPPEWDEPPAASQDPAAGPRFGRTVQGPGSPQG